MVLFTRVPFWVPIFDRMQGSTFVNIDLNAGVLLNFGGNAPPWVLASYSFVRSSTRYTRLSIPVCAV